MKTFQYFALLLIFSFSSSFCRVKDDNSTEFRLLLYLIISSSRNSKPSSLLYKPISISLSNANSSFSLGQAYVGRSSTNSEYAYWTLPVTNSGPTPFCFIQLSGGIHYKDSSGNTIASDSLGYTYVDGSVGFQSVLSTHTCLAVGELGYFAGIQNNVYTSLNSIAFSQIEVSATTPKNIAAKIIPQSYSVSNSKLSVRIKNEGSGSGNFGINRVFLLGYDNVPIFWSNLSTPSNDTILQTETGILDFTISYAGNSNKILPFLNFSSANDGSNNVFTGKNNYAVLTGTSIGSNTASMLTPPKMDTDLDWRQQVFTSNRNKFEESKK